MQLQMSTKCFHTIFVLTFFFLKNIVFVFGFSLLLLRCQCRQITVSVADLACGRVF